MFKIWLTCASMLHKIKSYPYRDSFKCKMRTVRWSMVINTISFITISILIYLQQKTTDVVEAQEAKIELLFSHVKSLGQVSLTNRHAIIGLDRVVWEVNKTNRSLNAQAYKSYNNQLRRMSNDLGVKGHILNMRQKELNRLMSDVSVTKKRIKKNRRLINILHKRVKNLEKIDL